MKNFTFLPHTADIKFKAQGKTMDEAFESSIRAFSHYVAEGKKIKDERKIKISLSARDNEQLLYMLLDHMIYLLEVEHFVPSHADIKIKNHKLSADVHGSSIGKRAIKQVKAATYAEMHIKKVGKMWEAQVVMDV